MTTMTRLLIAYAIIALAIFGVVGSLMARRQNVPLLQGSTEAEWIASIDYYRGNLAEIERWRSLGPEGTRMLLKALNRGNGPVESRYAKIWPKLPSVAQGRFPTPVEYRIATRVRAATLLYKVGPERSAVPALIRVLKREKREGIRATIIACFDFQKGLLDGMNKEKVELLPELLRDLHTPYSGFWINAVLALGSYRESAVVAPVLLKALRGSKANASIRCQTTALLALHHVAPQAAATPEVMEMIVHNTWEQDDPVAFEGLGRLLANLGTNASSAVPALTKRAHDTNPQIAEAAASALKKIDAQVAPKVGSSPM